MCDEVEKKNKQSDHGQRMQPMCFPFFHFLSICGQLNWHSVQQMNSFHIFLCMLSNSYIS